MHRNTSAGLSVVATPQPMCTLFALPPTPCALILTLLLHNHDTREAHRPVLQNASQIQPPLTLHR